ncbi:hypothetical protein [uncultured Pluralibacter sp.]|uniref:MrpH family fimbial adhesin n=1 Tax=uncultured Pluralibacter sp. TaxID=1490864 RepID=UPI002639870C|nr:hypothetical protein [uncultured Pluralibacter sp.]
MIKNTKIVRLFILILLGVTCKIGLAVEIPIGDIFFSIPDKNDPNFQMGLRNITFSGAIPNGVLRACNANADPATQSCALVLTCYNRVRYDTANTADLFIGMKYRMTGADLRSLLASSYGRSMRYFGCFKYVSKYKPMELYRTPTLRIAPVPAGGGTLSADQDVGLFNKAILPDPPAENTTCNTILSSEKINFGSFFIKQAEGLSRSINLNASCKNGSAFARFEVIGYPVDGILIRPDGSLKASIEINDVSANNQSSVYLEDGTTTAIPVRATLHAGPNLKSGAFSTNLIVKVTYD